MQVAMMISGGLGGVPQDRKFSLVIYLFINHGCQGWLRIGSDWPPNLTNLGLFKIIFSFLYILAHHVNNVLKLILKSPRFVPVGANLATFNLICVQI